MIAKQRIYFRGHRKGDQTADVVSKQRNFNVHRENLAKLLVDEFFLAIIFALICSPISGRSLRAIAISLIINFSKQKQKKKGKKLKIALRSKRKIKQNVMSKIDTGLQK